MIRRLFCIAIAAALLISACAYAENPQPELIRLQVIAADDSDKSQDLKQKLRDECLRCAQICLAGAEDADAAYILLENHVQDFQDACEARARELGYSGNICAETGIFSFPDRIYGDALVPAGDYRALRITIGAGEGHNWWCVLYPTLCIINEEHAAGEIRYHSRVLEWLKARFGGIA